MATMAATDSAYEVYFEAQDEGSALCGQHAINNLLQGAYFTAIDLGQIGAKLDEQEQNLLHSIDEDTKLSDDATASSQNNKKAAQPSQTDIDQRERRYSNVSMEGLFSVDVLVTALKSLNIDAMPLSHPDCFDANLHPDREQGFIFFQMSHWIAYRALNGVWYDLNSSPNYLLVDSQPTRITEFFLSAQLSKLQDEGFQVFVIRGALPTLGRLAPKTNDLKGEYAWVQSADIKSHVELDKMSRVRQQREQQRKTQQLMATDPQQYAALTGDNMPMARNLQSSFEQQQYAEYERYHRSRQQKNGSNSSGSNNNGNRFKNPFHKLRNVFNSNSNSNSTQNHNSNPHQSHKNEARAQYTSELERAKQESLRTAQQEQQKRISFDAYAYTNAADIRHNGIGGAPYTQQQIMVVSSPPPPPLPPPHEPSLIGGTATNEDIQLAMALSASAAATSGPPPPLPPPHRPLQRGNEPVELEYAPTQNRHNYKAMQMPSPPPMPMPAQPRQIQCQDFLNLPSMHDRDDEKQLQPMGPMVDDNDPFAALIREYSQENGVTQHVDQADDMVIVQKMPTESQIVDEHVWEMLEKLKG